MAEKGISTTAEPLEYGEYLRLIEHLDRDKQYRWELFCVLACAFALRVSDALRLTWYEVLNVETFWIKEGKTGKEKRIKVNPSVRNKINDLYVKMGKPDLDQLIFLSKRTGRPYTKQNVGYHLRNYKRKYLLPVERFSSHSFRKTYGQKAYKDLGETDRALIVVGRELNHSDPAVTRRYIGIKDVEYETTYNAIQFC